MANGLGKRGEVRHRVRLLEGAPGVADGVVEFRPLLRLVFGFVQVADGAKSVWVYRGQVMSLGQNWQAR